MKWLFVFVWVIGGQSFAANKCSDYFVELIFRQYEENLEFPQEPTKSKVLLSSFQKLGVLDATIRHFENLSETDFIHLFGFSKFEVVNAHAELELLYQEISALQNKPQEFTFKEPSSINDMQLQAAYEALMSDAKATSHPAEAKKLESFKLWRDLLMSSVPQRYSIFN